MPEDYDTLKDKDGIVKGIYEECAHVREEKEGSGYLPDYMGTAIKTALGFRPIRNAQDMLRYGQTVYDCAARCLSYCQPVGIVTEIERQTRIKLIRVRDAHWRLYPGHYPRHKARGFSAASYMEKEKVLRFWTATALAITYGGGLDLHWLVQKLVDDSFPTKCCACNRRLGRESLASLLPDDAINYKLLCEAAENDQLKLRCFCSWRCQPSDRSAQWHLKQLKQPHKELSKFQRKTQKEPTVWNNALLRRCLEWTDGDSCAFPLCTYRNAKSRWNLCRYHKAQLNGVLRDRRIARDNILKENL
jgi:hypothetical protein